MPRRTLHGRFLLSAASLFLLMAAALSAEGGAGPGRASRELGRVDLGGGRVP